METDRITIRLPKIYLNQIDLFIKAGEFMTRSEVIRHAVNEYISNHAGRIIEKADKLKKVQELGAAVEAIEPYVKK
ncbi:MAG: ribbon-helix-helix domain-containing protein [Petrotogales bacterium]